MEETVDSTDLKSKYGHWGDPEWGPGDTFNKEHIPQSPSESEHRVASSETKNKDTLKLITWDQAEDGEDFKVNSESSSQWNQESKQQYLNNNRDINRKSGKFSNKNYYHQNTRNIGNKQTISGRNNDYYRPSIFTKTYKYHNNIPRNSRRNIITPDALLSNKNIGDMRQDHYYSKLGSFSDPLLLNSVRTPPISLGRSPLSLGRNPIYPSSKPPILNLKSSNFDIFPHVSKKFHNNFPFSPSSSALIQHPKFISPSCIYINPLKLPELQIKGLDLRMVLPPQTLRHFASRTSFQNQFSTPVFKINSNFNSRLKNNPATATNMKGGLPQELFDERQEHQASYSKKKFN